MIEYFKIGQIVNTHGVRGEVKVYPLTDNIDRFSHLEQVYIEIDGNKKNYKVEKAKYSKNMVILKLNGIDTIEDALSLKQKYLIINRKDAIKLPEDTYYIGDLIDMEVYDLEGIYLGKVIDILRTGSNDVYIVQNDKKQLLIPGLKSIFREINIKDRKITVELPEGLE